MTLKLSDRLNANLKGMKLQESNEVFKPRKTLPEADKTVETNATRQELLEEVVGDLLDDFWADYYKKWQSLDVPIEEKLIVDKYLWEMQYSLRHDYGWNHNDK